MDNESIPNISIISIKNSKLSLSKSLSLTNLSNILIQEKKYASKTHSNLLQTISQDYEFKDVKKNRFCSATNISSGVKDSTNFYETLDQNRQFNLPNFLFINDSKSDLEDMNNLKTSKIEINKNDIKKPKRSAFAWVGKSMGRVKKNHTYHFKNNHSTISNHKKNISNSIQTANTDSIASILRQRSSKLSFKYLNQNDWSENANQGMHIWLDFSSNTNETCFLSEPDTLEFHNFSKSIKCDSQSTFKFKKSNKKKCLICKITAHETCIQSIQKYVKCKTTFRELNTKKISLKEKYPPSSLSTNANLHHWLCRKYDEAKFGNKCYHCQKNFTNKFGSQTARNVICCSWCKISFHIKCFSKNLLEQECNFGEFSNLIVPPNWIVKTNNKYIVRSNFVRTYFPSPKCDQEIDLERIRKKTLPQLFSSEEILSQNFANMFSIRPILCNEKKKTIKTILVLINPKSGGKLGEKLLKKFMWLLNPRQVFDLTMPGCPRLPLYIYRNVPNLCILVGGGDGTVGWVLSEIDQIEFKDSPPSVAVLPLGTGNDLSRALNWGSGYSDEPLTRILNRVFESRITKLDRWKIIMEPNLNSGLTDFEKDESHVCLKNDVMNNYFSIGADAHVCLEFHEKREANPNRFTSRWFNILQYLEAGSKDMIKKTWKNLKDYITLECDGKNYTDIIKSRGYHCIIFLNIPKYSSGKNPWGNFSHDNYQPQAINDGKLEVIGCFTSTLAKFQLGGYGERLCQANSIKLVTSTCIPIQIDGEPARLNPAVIEIFHKNQAIMLERVKNNTDNPNVKHNSAFHNNYEVKYIIKTDFDQFKRENDKENLRNKALYVGTISTSNMTESLTKVKQTIELLLKNFSNEFILHKWSFLYGDTFLLINPDSEVLLIDIISSDGTIYILDETISLET